MSFKIEPSLVVNNDPQSLDGDVRAQFTIVEPAANITMRRLRKDRTPRLAVEAA
jgi:hypothetical protein